MALVIVSSDWRFKDRFKEHFSPNFLHCFSSAERALATLSAERCDLVVIDSKLKGITAAELIHRLSEIQCSTPILLAYQSPDLRLCNTPPSLALTQMLREELSPGTAFSLLNEGAREAAHRAVCGLVGESKQMIALRRKLRRYGTQNCAVHLYGETGTGKELAAQYLHHLRHPYRNIVAINCSLLCTSLGSSMFFGHSKGAFTDGNYELDGLVCEADGTTLFLDEVENLSLQFQGHLLRLLENGYYRRYGDTTLYRSNFRLITASNERLATLVAQKRLRKDFYYRINDVEVVLPPLREHPEDIPLLVAHYLQRIRVRKPIDEASLYLLAEHKWPGNVRELFCVLKRAVIHAQHEDTIVVRPSDFPIQESAPVEQERRTRRV